MCQKGGLGSKEYERRWRHQFLTCIYIKTGALASSRFAVTAIQSTIQDTKAPVIFLLIIQVFRMPFHLLITF